MKNLAIERTAVLCVVLCGAALTANADTVDLSSVGGSSGSFDFTAYINRSINFDGSGYDQLNIMVSSMIGSESSFGIVDCEGTFSIAGSAGYEMASAAAVATWNALGDGPDVWNNWTASSSPGLLAGLGGQSSAPLSFVNFPSTISFDDGQRTGSGEHFTSFFGGWYNTASSQWFGAGGQIATLYVPTGWTPANGSPVFSGKFGFGDGTVEDSTLMLGSPIPGDANADGRVDINDLTIVLANYNKSGMTWSEGDFTGDGKVDINDLTIVLAHYNQTAGTAPAAVPEPSSVYLLSVGAIGLLACAWRRWGKTD